MFFSEGQFVYRSLLPRHTVYLHCFLSILSYFSIEYRIWARRTAVGTDHNIGFGSQRAQPSSDMLTSNQPQETL